MVNSSSCRRRKIKDLISRGEREWSGGADG